VLQFDDGAIARILIAASRFERDADRTALLERFAYLAERRPPERPENNFPPAGHRLPRSPVAAHMRRYRARLKRGVAIVPVPVTHAIVGLLVREGLLRRDREAYGREEIGRAIAAVLERLAR
jgi:hypothetical protein